MSAPPIVDLAVVAARVIPIPVTAQSVLVASDRLALSGWTLRETTGAASADVQLVDGQVSNGVVIAEITLSPGQSVRDTAGALPLLCERGVFLAITAGTVRGALWAAEA